MYIFLFGNESLRLYDLIGVLGYGVILAYFLLSWRRLEPGKRWLLPLAVQLVAFTFAGERLAPLVGRGTEFFGFLTISAVGLVLASLSQGVSPLERLDRSVPLYLTLASLLKLSCFCAGCCYGHPWVYGFYNQRNGQAEVPVQLVEMVLYALLLWLLRDVGGRPGRRFALLLVGYAGIRFVVQFFRADEAVFTLFHWMSAGFFALGVVGLLLCWLVPEKPPAPEQEEENP